MNLIKKTFITHCILLTISLMFVLFTSLTFTTCYDLLHSGDWTSIIGALIFIPFFFLIALGTLVLGIIEVLMGVRNVVKIRTWYTIVMLVVSCLVVATPIVLFLLLLIL